MKEIIGKKSGDKNEKNNLWIMFMENKTLFISVFLSCIFAGWSLVIILRIFLK